MTDDSLHKQSSNDEPQQEPSAVSESPPLEPSPRGYATLAEVADGEVRAVPRRRLSLNWVLLVLVIIVWSVAIGLYLSSFSTIPSAPLVALEKPVAETRLPFPARDTVETATLAPNATVEAVTEPETGSTPEVLVEVPAEDKTPAAEEVAEPVYRLTIGPFIDTQAQQQAVAYLKQQEVTVEQLKGEGPVRMIRLFAGSYPPAEAEQQLRRLQAAVPSAFGLPDNGRRALYAASFQSRERADALQQTLAEGGISVTQQAAEVTMAGNLLVTQQVDQKAAERIARYFEDSGINVHSEKQQP